MREYMRFSKKNDRKVLGTIDVTTEVSKYFLELRIFMSLIELVEAFWEKKKF